MRNATRSDAADLALLVDIASHGFASWLWHGAVAIGLADTPLEHGRSKLAEDGGTGAWQDATVAELQGAIAGAAIGYLLTDAVRDLEAGHAVLEPIMSLQKHAVGSWFVSTLAVYRQQRGKGAGRYLLLDQMRQADGGPVSLITESHNEMAQTFYRRHGFSERARLDAVPLFEKARRHAWVLMVNDGR
nr:GNAT family N-acetyltransferase [Rhizobium sp. CG5]